jgi:hypothetical protein
MLSTENVVTLSEAAAHLPRLNGRKPHTSTLWRWARKGIRGIKLETRRVGGRFVTSVEALDRFAKTLSEIPLADRPDPPPKPPTDRQRQRSVEQAERTLAKAGIL